MDGKRGIDLDDLCRILESGANVSTIVTEFHHPDSLDAGLRRRVEDACQRGGTSLYATGPSPGWITEVLPLTVTALARRLDRLTIEELADMATRNSPELVSAMFGRDPEKMDLRAVAERLGRDFGASFRQLADALSVPLDEVTAAGRVAAAAKTVQIGVATIEAGTVAAWRFEITGLRKGKPLLVFRPTWYVSRDLDPAWDVRDSGWHVVVEGDAPLDIEIRFAKQDYARISPGYTAHIAVNAVPAVCEAKPGIRTTVDLPRILPTFG
jgi:4-hydroxy-tetrahydrodipicolinate reductase